MTNNAFIVAGSYSIAGATVIGLIRIRKLNAAYRPFIYISIVSLLSEFVSHMLILHHKSNAVAINVFGILDALLWMWQFRRWNTGRKNTRFKLTAFALILLWITENIVLGKFFVFGSVYPLTFSFVMVAFSAIQLSMQIRKGNYSLLSMPECITCCGGVIFYSYRILVECFYAPGKAGSEMLLGNLFVILSVVNLIVNLFYVLVVLWIPQKQKYSLPFY